MDAVAIKMNKKPRHLKIASAVDAIPSVYERYMSANEIFNRQHLPRLPRCELYPMLEGMAQDGMIDGISTGYMRLYRNKDSVSIAESSLGEYNDRQRNQFSLDANIDWLLQTLNPVSKGKVVHLWMDTPNKTGKKTTRDLRRQLVIISPGTCVGFPREVVLISVIGKGSSLVRPIKGDGVANLVLAGMPASLAKLLMSTLNRVMKER